MRRRDHGWLSNRQRCIVLTFPNVEQALEFDKVDDEYVVAVTMHMLNATLKKSKVLR
jgi:hypothetical protein